MDFKKSFLGAQIILCTKEKNPLILVGVENFNNIIKGLGGQPFNNETPEETAIREFYEESCGSIYTKNQLKNLMKNSFQFIHKNKNGEKYFFFIIAISKPLNIENQFYLSQNLLLNFKDIPSKILKSYLEKKNIYWLPVNHILKIENIDSTFKTAIEYIFKFSKICLYKKIF